MINFLRLIHPYIILKEFILAHHKENEDQFLTLQGQTLFARYDKQNQGTIPMPTFATRPLTTSSTLPVEFPQNSLVGQQRQQKSELQFDKFTTPSSFPRWKIRFKNQVTTCSDSPSKATLWIKEVELADSVDELRSSSSTRGISMPNFEVLGARIASALNKIILNSQFKKKVSLEEQKSPKRGSVSTGKTSLS